jgi:hypothetical protein
MKCFISVLKGIGIVAAFMGAMMAFSGVLLGAGIATQRLFALPDVAGIGFSVLYMTVAFGTAMGISECRRNV